MINSLTITQQKFMEVKNSAWEVRDVFIAVMFAILVAGSALMHPSALTYLGGVINGDVLPIGAEAERVAGEYLIKLRQGNALDALTAAYGLSVKETIAEQLYLVTSEVESGMLLALLNANKQVEYAEPNFIYRAAVLDISVSSPINAKLPLPSSPSPASTADSSSADSEETETAETPEQKVAVNEPESTSASDPSFNSLWGLHNTGQTEGTVDADIDAPEAWDIRTSSDIVVGIIDTGVDYTHEDLAANIWENTGEIEGNGIDDDGNGFVDDIYGWDFVNNDNDPFDDHGHGTHVAGTIGAVANNDIGVVGVNWDIKMAGLKFLSAEGSGTTANAAKAVLYANKMGFKITNNSWGGGGYSQALADAIKAGSDTGYLFVAAAGNSGRDADKYPSYPAAYALSNIVSVAATDHNDNKANFSNYGLISVDLGAPGVNIYSTVPHGNSGAEPSCDFEVFGVCLNENEGSPASCELCDPSGYLALNGTSMATPHLVGAAALVWAEHPLLPHVDVKRALMKFSDPVSALAGNTASGGRLNLAATLEKANTLPPNTQPTAAIVAPAEGDPRTTIVFNGSGSSDAEGDRLSYHWDFGDGSSVVTAEPTAPHSYYKGGEYAVTLTVSDGFLASAPFTHSILIQGVEMFSQTDWSSGMSTFTFPFYTTTTHYSTETNIRTEGGRISLADFELAEGTASADSGVWVKQGTFKTSVGAGTQSITEVGFKPKAIVFLNGGENNGSGEYKEMRLGVGFAAAPAAQYRNQAYGNFNAYAIDGVDTGGFGYRARHTEATVYSLGIFEVKDAASGYSRTNGETASGEVLSYDEDGFTIEWVGNGPNGVYDVHYFALGGPDITHTKVGSFDAGIGTTNISRLGFQPDFLMVISTGVGTYASGGSSDERARISIGFGDSELRQGAASMFVDSGGTDLRSCRYADDSSIVALIGPSDCLELQTTARLVSMDPDGFTLQGTGNRQEMLYLAIKGGKHKVGNFTKRTDVGIETIGGVGFSPQGLVMMGINQALTTDIVESANMSVSVADKEGLGASVSGLGVRGTLLADPDRAIYHNKLYVDLADEGSEAALTETSADGFVMNWGKNNGTPAEMFYWAIGNAPPQVGGVLDSVVIDTEEVGGVSLQDIRWKGDSFDVAKDQIVKFQIATSDSEGGPWVFKGSDGTEASYYGGQFGPGTNIPISFNERNVKRYIRYRAILSSRTAISPTLDEIELRFQP